MNLINNVEAQTKSERFLLSVAWRSITHYMGSLPAIDAARIQGLQLLLQPQNQFLSFDVSCYPIDTMTWNLSNEFESS